MNSINYSINHGSYLTQEIVSFHDKYYWKWWK